MLKLINLDTTKSGCQLNIVFKQDCQYSSSQSLK